jgi:hypothetical protein
MASIELDDAMILPHAANLDGSNFRKGQVIDSQSVKTTESGGPRGYGAGKKIKGRKRHIVTDTQGNLSGWSCIKPTVRITMVPRACSLRSARSIHGCALSSPMAAMPARNCARR